MYEFLRDGELVQISIEEDRLSGFIQRLGEDGKGPVLDHFFTKATLDGNKLTFSTKTVHGVWFEFQGSVERGEAKTREEEGYFVLRGTLTQHAGDANKRVTSKSRQVAFKSFPRLD